MYYIYSNIVVCLVIVNFLLFLVKGFKYINSKKSFKNKHNERIYLSVVALQRINLSNNTNRCVGYSEDSGPLLSSQLSSDSTKTTVNCKHLKDFFGENLLTGTKSITCSTKSDSNLSSNSRTTCFDLNRSFGAENQKSRNGSENLNFNNSTITNNIKDIVENESLRVENDSSYFSELKTTSDLEENSISSLNYLFLFTKRLNKKFNLFVKHNSKLNINKTLNSELFLEFLKYSYKMKFIFKINKNFKYITIYSPFGHRIAFLIFAKDCFCIKYTLNNFDEFNKNYKLKIITNTNSLHITCSELTKLIHSRLA